APLFAGALLVAAHEVGRAEVCTELFIIGLGFERELQVLKRALRLMRIEIPTTEFRLFVRIVRSVLDERRQKRATLQTLFGLVRLIKPLSVARGELRPIIADELPARVRMRRDQRADGFELPRRDSIVLVVRARLF